ncbi:MAG: hypothetical protein HQ553_04455 [Chloroflexi bacterium]|nr:hypothetical protein [Chloroflexota bacterium]
MTNGPIENGGKMNNDKEMEGIANTTDESGEGRQDSTTVTLPRDTWEDVNGFTPMVEEVQAILKYWYTKLIDDGYTSFWAGGICQSCRERTVMFGRIKETTEVLTVDEVDQAVDEAYEEFERLVGEKHWKIYQDDDHEARRQMS